MPQQQLSVEPTLLLVRKRVELSLRTSRRKAFSASQINRLIEENKDRWLHKEIPNDRILRAIKDGSEIRVTATSQAAVLNALIEVSVLQAVLLPFPYRNETRFTWGEASTYELIQSVDAKGYFSHYSAMHLHGLTEQIPKTLYFNVEQPATAGGGTLTQQGIDRAFKGKCRTSNNVITIRDVRVFKLNGANTGRLGVESFKTDEGAHINVTNVERTLIDAVVRPVYSGGIGEVADAFRSAAEKVSVKRIVSYLRKLIYTYPYHQAIGYYMERSGVYKESDIDQLRKFPIEFDFYLNYQVKNPAYDKKWRLYVPQRF